MTTALQPWQSTDEQVALLKRTLADVHLTNDEFQMFVMVCNTKGLDPFSRQIYVMKNKGRVSIAATIDGLRLIAERTHNYQGQSAPQWCGPDGKWMDVWLSDKPPAAARVGVYKKGLVQPTYGVATWKEFGSTNFTWKQMPSHMLAKVAESHALRKAFPAEMAGLYEEGELKEYDAEIIQPDNEKNEFILLDIAEAQTPEKLTEIYRLLPSDIERDLYLEDFIARKEELLADMKQESDNTQDSDEDNVIEMNEAQS